MELKIVEQSDKLIRLALVGMLDAKGVQAVELKFLGHTAAKGKSTILDLSETTYISSIGIGMLLNASKSLQRKGAKLVILNPHPMVEEVLKASRLTEILPIARDAAEAARMAGI